MLPKFAPIATLYYTPNPRIESRQRSTVLLIPLPSLIVGRHNRYETALESKIVTRPLFHTPNPDIVRIPVNVNTYSGRT